MHFLFRLTWFNHQDMLASVLKISLVHHPQWTTVVTFHPTSWLQPCLPLVRSTLQAEEPETAHTAAHPFQWLPATSRVRILIRLSFLTPSPSQLSGDHAACGNTHTQPPTKLSLPTSLFMLQTSFHSPASTAVTQPAQWGAWCLSSTLLLLPRSISLKLTMFY